MGIYNGMFKRCTRYHRTCFRIDYANTASKRG